MSSLLANARAGTGGALTLRGEPGIGKTAIIDAALGAARDVRRVRVEGVELETDIAFPALHQLITALAEELPRVPESHRATLGAILGEVAGPPPDRFRAGLAVLALLSRAAHVRPVACVIDDAQWIDQASVQALAFAARRLGGHRVAVLVAVREASPVPELSGLPEITVPPLSRSDAASLMTRELRAPLDARVRERVLAEARGNPLALLELPRSVHPDELAGGFTSAPGFGVVAQLEQRFHERLQRLPGPTRLVLGLAAAEPLGDPALLAGAAARLGLDLSVAEPAEAAGMFALDGAIRFRHPLVRSVAYHDLAPGDRRRVHAALAAVTSVAHDPERRVWHLAQAALEPDEELAGELVANAARAQARGGVAAAAAFLERAVALTPSVELRASRALDAAIARFLSGSPDAALRLLATVEAGPSDAAREARVQALRARLTYFAGNPTTAPQALADAAGALTTVDAEVARATFLEAFGAALFAGRFVGGEGLARVSRAARDAVAPGQRPHDVLDRLLDAVTAQVLDGHVAAAGRLRAAVDAYTSGATADDRTMPWMWLACSVATDLWDEEAWRELAQRQIDRARGTGALVALPVALHYRSLAAIHEADFALAQRLNDEAAALDAAGGTAGLSCADLVLAAWRGDHAAMAPVVAYSIEVATARYEGRTLTAVEHARIVLANGTGQYEEALTIGLAAWERDEPGFHSFVPHEVVEAGVRAGRPERVQAILEPLAERASVAGTSWARGIELRSRALLAERDGDDADALYRAAIEELERSAARAHLARTYLVHGEWLRRRRRTGEARTQLRRAAELLRQMGADAFADRAVRELEAAGGRGPASGRAELTPQERTVAELVAGGATSKEVAAQLVVSPRTVDAHLRSIFAKLGITSRRQLRARLDDRAALRGAPVD